MAIPLAPFTLGAHHPQTGESTPNTSIDFPQNVTSLTHDLVFISTGNVRGSVTRHNGAAVSSGYVQVALPLVGYLYSNIDANGNFGFTGIRQGDFVFTATVPHPQGQDMVGSGSYSVVAGQTSIANITIEPTGTITGVVRTFAGDPVVDAVVYLDSAYYPYRITRTDTAGLFTFSDVSVGEHTVTTAEPRTGTLVSASATVSVDQVTTVTLRNPGVGTISVQVNFARGGGAPDASVSVGNVGATTDSSGRASFTKVVGSYAVYATHPNNGRLTGNGTATLAQDGGSASVTITLPSAGVVTGVVRRADGVTRAPGIAVSLLSFNPVQGGQILSAYTDAQGVYRIAGVPDGNLYLKVIDTSNSTFADASSAITSDGQELSVDLTLLNNTIPLPVNRYDANNFLSDIQQNGVILTGQNSVFNVGTTQRRGAALLQISDAAGTYSFTGNNTATLSALGRQLTINQVSPIAGLHVSRKVFVPGSGYFTRYLEILDNPGATDITVNVQIDTRYANSGIITTSSGDANLDSATTPDYWVTLDDGADADPFMSSSLPATAHVFDAPGASHLANVLGYRVEGDGVRTLGYRFNAVTVPAGAKVVLMHFVVEQINRAGAKAAAERLVSLPPEALEALEPDEIAAIANMPLPASGQSAVAPLTALTGSISGRVLEGDNATVVNGAYVRVRSSHPLFNRTWQYSGYYSTTCGQYNVNSLISTANGNYSLVGRIIEGSSVPVPVDADLLIQVVPDSCYDATRGHPMTGVQSPVYTPRFAEGTSALAQDIVFPTGILTGTVVGPADFGVTSGSINLPAANGVRAGAVSILGDGTYSYPGLAAGTYTLNVSVPHPQGSDLTGIRTDAVATTGRVTVVDVPLQPTGALSGTVITTNGEASANSTVRITNGNFYRQTTSDSLGRYAFTAVPVGTYSLTVRDGFSGAATSPVSVSVGQNQTTTQNVRLLGLGSVQLQVNFARGVVAFDAPVYLQAAALGSGETLAGHTDLNGRVTIANIPVGNFSLHARHPTMSALSTVLNGIISANGEVQQGTLVLRPVANIALTVLDQDSNNAPAAGASVVLTDAVNGYHVVGTTSSAGLLNILNIPEGSYTIAVTDAASGATGGVSGTVGVAEDGQTLARTVSITADHSVLGVIDYRYERDIYSFTANAGDVISVRINGMVVGTSTSLYLPYVDLFNPSRTLLARGYGYSADNGNFQDSDYNNLTSTVASVTGNYGIAVRAYYQGYAGYETGGYRLSVSVNGIPVALSAYANGGSITGHLYRVDGTTPVAGQRLNLRGSSYPLLNANVVTDAAGAYTFSGVPFGANTLAAIDADQRQPISVGVQVSGTTPVVSDLIMPAKNTLNISVVDASGVTTAQNTRVDVTDMSGTIDLYTNATGNIVTTVYGNNVTVRAYNPQNNLPTALTVTPPADNETLSVNVTLAATGTLTGLVTSGGTAVPNAQVSVNFYLNGYYNLYASTDASGAYTLSYLPLRVALNVSTHHPQNSSIIASAVTQLGTSNEIQTVNFALAAIGSISGRLAYASGSPAANAYLTATNTATGAQISTYSDATGNYQFAAIEVGVHILVRAQNPNTYAQVSRSVIITSAGQVLVGQDMTFEPVGSITGRVLNASGAPLANQYVYATYVYDAQNGYSTSRDAYTNASGVFRIDNLPAGQAINIRASHPTIPNMQTRVSATLTTDGQILTVDIVHAGTGSITGQVVNTVGDAVANSRVRATYVYDAVNNYTTYFDAYTDAKGQYRFDNLPLAQAIALRAYDPKLYNRYADASETLTSNGQVLVASPIVLSGVYSISGTVTETTAKTGTIYLRVYDAYCTGRCSPRAGTTVPTTGGAYTIRGLQYGSYVVNAEMDVLNSGVKNAGNPAGNSATVSITGSNATGVNITVADVTPPTPVTPTGLNVNPSSGAAFIFWDTPRDANGTEIASDYKIYWSTNPDATTGASSVIVPAREDGHYVQSGLTNGSILYYKISALVDATESAASAVTGPVNIGDTTALNTVSGAVTFTGTATGGMLVGLFSDTGVYFTRIASPASPQSYSITGVPNGSYQNFAVIDMNNNGIIDAGDISNTEGNAPTITVTTNTNTSSNLTLSSASANATVTTDHGFDGTSHWYNLNLQVSDGTKRVTAVTLVSGKNVGVPFDLGKDWEFRTWQGLGATSPTVGDSYVFKVTYSDGTTDNLSASVTAVLDTSVMATNPVVNTAAPYSRNVPQFTWAAPTAPLASYTYKVSLYGNANWWYPDDGGLPNTTLSALYNADGRANPSSLTPGVTYSWQVIVRDANDNQATRQTTYTP